MNEEKRLSQSPSVLELDSVSVIRRGRRILDGLSLVLAEKGQVCGILGPNGAGKTCLLKVVTGLMRPQEGTVRVLGKHVLPGAMPAGVGALIEEPRFYPSLSGRDNLFVFAGGKEERIARIDELLDLVGLGHRAHDKVRVYSQGMRQRLGIARALLSDPALLILDEPANGLDPEGIAWLRDLVVSLRERGMTVVLASHVLSEVQRTCDIVVVISGGRIVAQGDVSEILSGFSSLEDLYFSLADHWSSSETGVRVS